MEHTVLAHKESPNGQKRTGHRAHGPKMGPNGGLMNPKIFHQSYLVQGKDYPFIPYDLPITGFMSISNYFLPI